MLSGLHRWKGTEMPSKIGTAKLTQAVVLCPQQEHLVWAKLPATVPVSEGTLSWLSLQSHTHARTLSSAGLWHP